LRTAEATAAGTRATDPESGASGEGPASPDGSLPTEAPGLRTFDDDEGVRTGHWVSRAREDASGGVRDRERARGDRVGDACLRRHGPVPC